MSATPEQIAEAAATVREALDDGYGLRDGLSEEALDIALAALDVLVDAAQQTDALAHALGDAVSWIENYPLSDRPDTGDDWIALAAAGRAALAKLSGDAG